MKCPHCTVEINEDFSTQYLGDDSSGSWITYSMNCPNPKCKKLIVQLAVGNKIWSQNLNSYYLDSVVSKYLVRPINSSRNPVPLEVESKFANDYVEACLILELSPKASAALSRRCLQNILREKANVKKGDLSNEIKQVIESNTLPSHLAESIDAIRVIGNFAAHPIKSSSTGEIVTVELGEAEWLLDVLEALFDYFFVQPTIIKAKKEALNKKLIDSGKPPLK